MADTTSVRARQDPLRERYKNSPAEAEITDHARTTGGAETDPFHGKVEPGSVDYGISWPFGIHAAVGGYHDAPNPGDILCAALATCLDSTIRMIADRIDVSIEELEVDVTADVDLRGTLAVDRKVPVGFQAMRCNVDLVPASGTPPEKVDQLLRISERSCVVLQTLRSSPPIDVTLA